MAPSPDDMRRSLDGMHWRRDGLEFRFLRPAPPGEALRRFRKGLPGLAAGAVAVFEGVDASASQAAEILGGGAAGLGDLDRRKIARYGEAALLLAGMAEEGAFALDAGTARLLHGVVGREEALTWGVFRNSQVWIGGVSRLPPHHARLPELAERGLPFLRGNFGPAERAAAAFLFLSRTQFFHDANKRTASLMMNGVLLRAGLLPALIPPGEARAFAELLAAFYESGDATEIMRFLAEVLRPPPEGPDGPEGPSRAGDVRPRKGGFSSGQAVLA